ncbi:MAG: hypothetical protein WBF71_02935 [Microthrixaceae bacterium]
MQQPSRANLVHRWERLSRHNSLVLEPTLVQSGKSSKVRVHVRWTSVDESFEQLRHIGAVHLKGARRNHTEEVVHTVDQLSEFRAEV